MLRVFVPQRNNCIDQKIILESGGTPLGSDKWYLARPDYPTRWVLTGTWLWSCQYRTPWRKSGSIVRHWRPYGSLWCQAGNFPEEKIHTSRPDKTLSRNANCDCQKLPKLGRSTISTVSKQRHDCCRSGVQVILLSSEPREYRVF